VMFTITLGLWAEAYRWRRQQRWQWLGLTGAVVILALALILTSSRNAWLMALLVTTVFIVYLQWYSLVAIAAGIVSAIAAAAFAPSPINLWLQKIIPRYLWARVNDQMYSDRAIETLRSTQWDFTWDLIQQRPFFGWGLRNFTPLYQEATGIWLGHPHNLPLMLGAEIGIPGLLLLLILVGSAIAQGAILLTLWSEFSPTPGTQQWQQDQLIFFTFILAFLALTCFNLLDVTLFDLRVNLLAWLLLGGISGVSHYHRHLLMGKKLTS
jgi:O-antigen ligase